MVNPSINSTMDPSSETNFILNSVLTIILSPTPTMDPSNKSNVGLDFILTIIPSYNPNTVPSPPSSNAIKVITITNASVSFMDSNILKSFDCWYGSSLFNFSDYGFILCSIIITPFCPFYGY